VYIDDYAHHPEELRACITSARKLYPNKHITGVFQPHLFTRTRDFYKEFAQSLSMLDEVVLFDIYPARELPIEGVTSSMIFDEITISNKKLIKKDDFINYIKQHNNFDVLITMGAGDIDRLPAQIAEVLKLGS
jgi:UDP-N-acetylmuramate--alanine ligase